MKRILPTGSGPSRRRRRFSLVELLVVMGIMVMLLGLSFPTLERMAIGNGVDVGARMVTSQLRLARQQALSNHKCIALLIPASSTLSSNTKAPILWYTAFRLCAVKYNGSAWVYDGGAFILDNGADGTPGTSDDVTSGFFPGSNWDFLPIGAVILELNITPTYSGGTGSDMSDKGFLVKNVPIDVGTSTPATIDCRAVIFKRTGTPAYDTGSAYIKVVQGVLPPDGSALRITNEKNYLSIELNPYTGKVTQVLSGT